MAYDDYYYYGFRPYVSVAARRAQAARELAKLRKNGRAMSPVAIEGRKIARTFWGEAWCDNLERYSDYANRLPRGRTYLRNGSVVDLQVGPGRVTALVSGSAMYNVQVTVGPVPRASWSAICKDCSGAIDSLVELLQGRFSKGVMTRLCEQKTGLLPSPKEILFTCSCPDWASMCKHVAAVLYGIGARLDHQPELLFTLRKVDQQDLIATADPILEEGQSDQPARRCSRVTICRRCSASRWRRRRRRSGLPPARFREGHHRRVSLLTGRRNRRCCRHQRSRRRLRLQERPEVEGG